MVLKQLLAAFWRVPDETNFNRITYELWMNRFDFRLAINLKSKIQNCQTRGLSRCCLSPAIAELGFAIATAQTKG